jgi:ankyrin repeat protein
LTFESFYARRRKVSKEVQVMSEEFFNAIKEGESARVEQMISRNPSLVNAKNSQGMSPVTVATYYGKSKIAEVLVSRGAKLNLYEASITGKLEAVKDILRKNPAEANSLSPDGFSSLHLAAFFGHAEIVKYLLEMGADANTVANNRMKVMPLHSAVAHNQLEISEILIVHGAEVNAKQEGGFVPLHAAAQSGNLEMARLLLKHGAEVNVKSNDGRTPLALTKEEGPEAGRREDRERVAGFLIEKGGV